MSESKTIKNEAADDNTNEGAVVEQSISSQHREYVFIHDEIYSWLPAKILSESSSSSPPSAAHDDNNATVTVRIVLPSDWKEITHHPRRSTLSQLPSSSSNENDDPSLIRAVNLKDYPDFHLPLQNVDANGKLKEQADIADMKYVHEASVLYNLRERHKKGFPYTRVGEIIVAMNPFEWHTDLYTKEKQMFYAKKLIWKSSPELLNKSLLQLEGSNRILHEPHVYETSSNAYRGLALESKDQAILVSGESGAGKTETVKIVMAHLATIQTTRPSSSFISGRGGDELSADAASGENIDGMTNPTTDEKENTSAIDDDDARMDIVSKVLQSNPVFEAFGNAKTVRNDNSSRFGRLTKLYFAKDKNRDVPTRKLKKARRQAPDSTVVPTCILIGSSFETFLLEKARVVAHSLKERTFHIFYQLLAAPSSFKEELFDGFGSATRDSFRYVGDVDTDSIEGKTDAESFEQTKSALETFGIEGEELQMLMRALCIVLQLGNLTFEPDSSVEGEGARIVADDELAKMTGLMGVGPGAIQKAMTMRLVKVRGEEIMARLTPDESRDSCDALAKEIYSQVVDVLIRKMNDKTLPRSSEDTGRADQKKNGFISLLDLFGFEKFEENRFEQLCINYANEHLQHRYVLDNFRSVKDHYEFEGIEMNLDCSSINNSEILNLLEGRMGLFSIMNEECVRPKGNDSSFVYKAKMIHRDSTHLVSEKLHRSWEFGVKHFADVVTYDATKFVERNTDQLPIDLLECTTKCTNFIISTQFKALLAERKKQEKDTHRKRGAMSMTICSKFRTQLTGLINHLSGTRTRYIRCIKPNTNKKPHVTDHIVTMRQLGSAGLVIAIDISHKMFPNQLPYDVVLDRFYCLFRGSIDPQLDCKRKAVLLLTNALKDDDRVVSGCSIAPYVCGKTKVFFRSGALEKLESDRWSVRNENVCRLQNYAKTFIQWQRFRTMKLAAVKLQALWRSNYVRKEYTNRTKAAMIVYCWAKFVLVRIKRQRTKENKASIRIQSCWRGFKPREKLLLQKKAAVIVQRALKKRSDRQHFQNAFAECVEAARKQRKMKSLLHKLGRYFNSNEEEKSNVDDILQECELVISYLGKDLFLQRGKVSEVQAQLENEASKICSLQLYINTLEAEFAAEKLEVEHLSKEIIYLNQKLEQERKCSLNYKRSSKKLEEENIQAEAAHKLECTALHQKLEAQENELSMRLAKRKEFHAAEVLQLKDIHKESAEKHQKDINQMQIMFEQAQESYNSDFSKLLLAIEEGKSNQEQELKTKQESWMNQTKILEEKLQSSKLAHTEEVAVLSNKLEEVQNELDSKEGIIDSLQCQVDSLQEEQKNTTSKHAKDCFHLDEQLKSQTEKLFDLRSEHAAETEALENKMQSSHLAHTKEVSGLNKDLAKLRGELDSKDRVIDSLQSQVDSLQEECIVVAAKHEKEGDEMRTLLASKKDEMNMELSKMRELHTAEVETLKNKLQSVTLACSEEVSGLNKGLKKLQIEPFNSKARTARLSQKLRVAPFNTSTNRVSGECSRTYSDNAIMADDKKGLGSSGKDFRCLEKKIFSSKILSKESNARFHFNLIAKKVETIAKLQSEYGSSTKKDAGDLNNNTPTFHSGWDLNVEHTEVSNIPIHEYSKSLEKLYAKEISNLKKEACAFNEDLGFTVLRLKAFL